MIFNNLEVVVRINATFLIQKEQINDLADCIINILSEPSLYKSIVESDEINRDYIKIVNGFGKQKNYFLSENGWKYTIQIIKTVNAYVQDSISLSEILELKGYSDDFWEKMFEYLGYAFSKNKIENLEDEIPSIKIDTNSFQIYLSLNLDKFKEPETFSDNIILHFNNDESRIYFNQICDFKDRYYGNKVEKENDGWSIAGIEMNMLPLYFSSESNTLIQNEDLVVGWYYCIEKKEGIENSSKDSPIRSFRLNKLSYLITKKYIDTDEIKAMFHYNDTNDDINPIEIEDANLEKAWQAYGKSDYYDAINYLGRVDDSRDNNVKSLKLILRLCIYLKTLRLTTLDEELKRVESLSYFDGNLYNLFLNYCSVFVDNRIKPAKLTDAFISKIPFELDDKILFRNLVDIMNNYDNLSYLSEYKDSKNYLEILFLFKIFQNNGTDNLYKDKLGDIILELPSSPELKELLKEI